MGSACACSKEIKKETVKNFQEYRSFTNKISTFFGFKSNIDGDLQGSLDNSMGKSVPAKTSTFSKEAAVCQKNKIVNSNLLVSMRKDNTTAYSNYSTIKFNQDHQGNVVENIFTDQEKKNNLKDDNSIIGVSICTEQMKENLKYITNKRTIVVLGSSGSGKSIQINFLNGCEMEFFSSEKLNHGSYQNENCIRIKNTNSTIEVAEINHNRGNRPNVFSKAYIDNRMAFTYYEYAGNDPVRGFEINMSNQGSLKQVVKYAKEMAFVITIKYSSLYSDGEF